MSIGIWALVAILGGAGAVGRFLADGFVARRARGDFPWGTLAVNLTGAAVLGVLTGAALHGTALFLAGTATLGSYTTFSTWMLETHRLGQDGELALGMINVAASLLVGFAAAAFGHAIGAGL
jgi:CrcB protein